MCARSTTCCRASTRRCCADLAAEIDASIAGFVRGQVTVCLILAAYYATALGLIGLQFGLAIGVTAGLISFIPYIGAIIGGVLAIGVGLWQFWGSPVEIGLVLAVFAFGQVLEGNILVPRIVGNSVRLHPVWLLFAVSAFGALLGFTGMLIAVPLAASIGVLVRFGVGQYMDSKLYGKGGGPHDAPADRPAPVPARAHGPGGFRAKRLQCRRLGAAGRALARRAAGAARAGRVGQDASGPDLGRCARRGCICTRALAAADLPGHVAQARSGWTTPPRGGQPRRADRAVSLAEPCPAHGAEVLMAARAPARDWGCDPARPGVPAWGLHPCRRRRAR